MKIFVTGNSGSGKTTLLPELARRGFSAYNIDDMPGVCRLEDTATGKPVNWPTGYINWETHAWRVQSEPLRKLVDSASNVAIAAIVKNQQDFYDWFDLRFIITIDNEALARHWQHSTDHHKDMNPKNLERALSRNKLNQAKHIAEGCIPITGDRPIGQMAGDIMEVVYANGGMA